MRKNGALLIIILACIVIGLLAALTPIADIDNDGLLDSLITEGFVLIPVICSVTVLYLLLTKLPSACIQSLQFYSSLLLPPPIFN
jgi:quinol-cytochrome oxidoreductase complex cytochrome b subunit